MLKIGLNEVEQVNCESLGILQRESRVAVVDPEVHGADDQLLGVGGELELGSEGWIGLSSPHSTVGDEIYYYRAQDSFEFLTCLSAPPRSQQAQI